MPILGVLSGARSFFGSRLASNQPARVPAPRDMAVSVEAKRICDVTGKKRNKANKVCFSNKKSRTFQEVNLQVRFFPAITAFP
jgi:large subunit ribosomal protein L28